jgi:alpha-D-xyloside xylohydrolase
MTFWVGSKELSKTEVAVEADHLDYFFFAGDIKTVLANYTALTGRSAMPPRFSFGVWMSRMSYRSQEEVLAVARRLRQERFPCDVIHIDDDWFQEAWRCDWQFDEARFPDPAQMCKELHELGFRVSLWQEPYVIRKTPLWNEACAKGYLAKAPVPILFASKFEAAPIDFTNPDAARWYRERLLRPLLELGIDVIKTDFGEGVEPGMQFRAGDGHALLAARWPRSGPQRLFVLEPGHRRLRR